eukprot:gene7751-12221_t
MSFFFLAYIFTFVLACGLCVLSGYILLIVYDYEDGQYGSIDCAKSINQVVPVEYVLLGITFFVLLFSPDRWLLLMLLPFIVWLFYKYFTGNSWVKHDNLYQDKFKLKVENFVKIGWTSIIMFCYFFCFVRDIIYLVQEYSPHYYTKRIIPDGPNLQHFITNSMIIKNEEEKQVVDLNSSKKIYIETYGCQMNVSDTEIVTSILKKSGYSFIDSDLNADVILINTCAIRDNAEQKIWNRLKDIKGISKNKKQKPIVGILGCMAERLKKDLLEKEQLVDLVMGPDSYRDLPNIISNQQKPAINVMLSLDETYADISPVRRSNNNISAFVSIMRGCDNMCSYCIVPFTRGRERSRPMKSILEEVKQLSNEGYKEIILLGQNVNSYRDISEENEKEKEETKLSNEGFKTIYKKKKGGIRFTELIDNVSKINENIRIRFTSPHPKDYPSDLIDLIKNRPNISKFLHIPAQSGNSNVLNRMRRGYSRDSYLKLLNEIREKIPYVTFSSDFISGFCGETEQEHQDTISLMEQVKFDQAFMFSYSLREKTHAHRNYIDDISNEIKKKRLNEIIQTFRMNLNLKIKNEIGNIHLVLIEDFAKKDENYLFGKSDSGRSVMIKNDDEIKFGQFVAVEIIDILKSTLIGKVIDKNISINQFFKKYKNL